MRQADRDRKISDSHRFRDTLVPCVRTCLFAVSFVPADEFYDVISA